MANLIDSLPAVLNKYPAQVRIAAIALVPAFIVFVAMELTRPAPPGPTIAMTADSNGKHVFNKTNFDGVSQLNARADHILSDLDKISAKPANAQDAVCTASLRNGVALYIDTVLARTRQDIGTSLSMQHTDDEKYINGTISASITTTIKSIPILLHNTQALPAVCLHSAAIAPQVNSISFLLTDTKSFLTELQKQIPGN